jgi:hypothetical protein
LYAAIGNGLTSDEATTLKAWLKKNSIDLKRRDARALIDLVMNREDGFEQPLQVSFEFEDTSFWQELMDRHEPDLEAELKSAS